MRKELHELVLAGREVMPGKDQEIELAAATILARGHLLIEDVPGMGKTTLVRFLAKVLGFEMKRIQFTNDLLPGDILGVTVFRPETAQFQFRAGPIFAEMVLADELNRAPPRTQSALLQAMEERMVTVEGQNYTLPSQFTVMATQNPRGMAGTFPLPESQLDRFLMKIPMGLPPREAEKALLNAPARRDVIEGLSPLLNSETVIEKQRAVERVKVSESILDYVMRLLEESRQQTNARALSPRAGLDIVRAAKAWAWLQERDYVLPDDVQMIFPAVAGHRLPLQETGCTQEHQLAQMLLDRVSVV